MAKLFNAEKAENAQDSDAEEGDPEIGKCRHRSPSGKVYCYGEGGLDAGQGGGEGEMVV